MPVFDLCRGDELVHRGDDPDNARSEYHPPQECPYAGREGLLLGKEVVEDVGVDDRSGEEHQDDERRQDHNRYVYAVALEDLTVLLGLGNVPYDVEHLLDTVHHPDDEPDEKKRRKESEASAPCRLEDIVRSTHDHVYYPGIVREIRIEHVGEAVRKAESTGDGEAYGQEGNEGEGAEVAKRHRKEAEVLLVHAPDGVDRHHEVTHEPRLGLGEGLDVEFPQVVLDEVVEPLHQSLQAAEPS